ncbi:2-nitropropane dioxygenase [Acidocella aquatica]|uniref:2-nitropropane dioxygenase n=1 Tax=Acidocella aquatica TaxID=1922313 RepID=A0ABQ6A962_9PROT|nr:nitronate monooxygenase family protein [Acidocella aquatica]GLR69025.1 2-nitropropane dioxygenase [Acidocella aquatica]
MSDLWNRLRLPVIGAPMFIVSTPELVIAQCKAGIIGSFPSLNARPADQLEVWLERITRELAAYDAEHPQAPSAPFAVNLIVHRSNARLESDLAVLARYRVPLVITSLGAQLAVNQTIHGWGGLVMHDIITLEHAKKAIDKGADGLIAVAAGAGGHAGRLSPFALVEEIRSWFQGPLALSGAIATGRGIAAARVLGADFAYIGSAFIATEEANASHAYKNAIVQAGAEDIIYTNYFTGIHGNYLRASLIAAGLDPASIPESDPRKLDFSEPSPASQAGNAKAWRDIWGAGQGIGAIHNVQPAQTLIARLQEEYRAARSWLAQPPHTS